MFVEITLSIMAVEMLVIGVLVVRALKKEFHPMGGIEEIKLDQIKGKTFESMTLDCIEPEITTADMIGNALEIKVTGDLHSEELDKGVHPDELERLRYLKGKN